MRVESVELPEPLLEAQQGGSLAVFAGAGISIAPPSNLPDLKAIVEKMEQEFGMGLEGEEPVDRYFGRLSDKGHPVHQRVCEMMDNPDSRPTPLHYDLLRLFGSAAQVRLVTTNFDRHFTTAARELYGDELEIFYAPALPLGHQVSGMVYLHGSVERRPDRIVLTDNDFGRAYLTEGWARRFLQTLLANQTVLFVGYSHNDPVMNYLARGLPPEVRDLARHRAARRFAFTPEKEPGHWEFVGITPITYPLSQGGNSHSSLGEAVAAWVELSKMGRLDHEKRIRSIVEQAPTPDKEDSDYLEAVLQDPGKASHFFKYACDPGWLKWAADKGVFDPLGHGDRAGEAETMAAEWMVGNFMEHHSEELLAVVEGLSPWLHPLLWRAVIQQLSAPAGTGPRGGSLARWVILLLQSPHTVEDETALAGLLAACCDAGDSATALLLFDHLCAPRLSGDSASPQVTLRGEAEVLQRAWRQLFVPQLAQFSPDLRPMLEGHMARARLLARLGRAEHHHSGEPDQRGTSRDNTGEGVLDFLSKMVAEAAAASPRTG